MNTPLSTCHQR